MKALRGRPERESTRQFVSVRYRREALACFKPLTKAGSAAWIVCHEYITRHSRRA